MRYEELKDNSGNIRARIPVLDEKEIDFVCQNQAVACKGHPWMEMGDTHEKTVDICKKGIQNWVSDSVASAKRMNAKANLACDLPENKGRPDCTPKWFTKQEHDRLKSMEDAYTRDVETALDYAKRRVTDKCALDVSMKLAKEHKMRLEKINTLVHAPRAVDVRTFCAPHIKDYAKGYCEISNLEAGDKSKAQYYNEHYFEDWKKRKDARLADEARDPEVVRGLCPNETEGLRGAQTDNARGRAVAWVPNDRTFCRALLRDAQYGCEKDESDKGCWDTCVRCKGEEKCKKLVVAGNVAKPGVQDCKQYFIQ